MASDTFVDVIGRVRADPALRPAFEADSWLALACNDLVREEAQAEPVAA